MVELMFLAVFNLPSIAHSLIPGANSSQVYGIEPSLLLHLRKFAKPFGQRLFSLMLVQCFQH